MVEPFVIGWADPGHVSGWFAHSMLETQLAGIQPNGQTLCRGHWRIESGPRIAAARNDIVKAFLESEQWKGVEWLLMVDSDMSWSASAVGELFEGMRDADGKVLHPIVGGLCFGGGHGGIKPTIHRVVDGEITIVTEWADREMVPCDATGAAFLLIHRGVLEAVGAKYQGPYPWFIDAAASGSEYGEDVAFCLRARMEGFPIYIATAAKIGHYKTVELNEDTWRTGQIGLKNHAPATLNGKPITGTLHSMSAPNRAQRRAKAS